VFSAIVLSFFNDTINKWILIKLIIHIDFKLEGWEKN